MNHSAIIALLLFAAGAAAQNLPFYANGEAYPRPFTSSDSDLSDRLGATTTEPAPRLDAYGHNAELARRVSELPKNQQPFWFSARDQIRQQIGLDPVTSTQATQTTQAAQPTQAAPST